MFCRYLVLFILFCFAVKLPCFIWQSELCSSNSSSNCCKLSSKSVASQRSFWLLQPFSSKLSRLLLLLSLMLGFTRATGFTAVDKQCQFYYCSKSMCYRFFTFYILWVWLGYSNDTFHRTIMHLLFHTHTYESTNEFVIKCSVCWQAGYNLMHRYILST